MTAQISDTFDFEGHRYALAGVKGGRLFDPKQFGLKPVSSCTACWRGYHCLYAIAQDRLVLERLNVTLEYPEGTGGVRLDGLTGVEPVPASAPEINGVRPTRLNLDLPLFNTRYDGLNLALDYTGKLKIADDFIFELYVHMGFHPAWKYRTVHELKFKKGRLVQARDVSGRMQVLRSIMRIIH